MEGQRAALRYIYIECHTPQDISNFCYGMRSRTSVDGQDIESVGWQNFGKMLLVFGCIGSDFCKKICVLQHFSKSTNFST